MNHIKFDFETLNFSYMPHHKFKWYQLQVVDVFMSINSSDIKRFEPFKSY